MNLCTFIGKRLYANELYNWCRKSAKLGILAQITKKKFIETDKSLMGSKSTNHGVHLPMNRWAFSYNQGLNCPSLPSLSSSFSCSSSLVPTHPFCFSNYAWVNSEYECSISSTMIEVVASYGPLRTCGPCLDHIWSCIKFVVPSVLMRIHRNVFVDHLTVSF